MRKGLILIVALFAIASLLGAMAYNHATVTSGQTLNVKATDKALLAIKPGTGIGNLDETAYVDANGILKIDFGKGLGEVGTHGLQPGSVYKWNKLISIQNKSKDKVKCTLNLTDGAANLAVAATVVEGTDNNNWFSNMLVWDNSGAKEFTLGPNTTIDLEFTITVPDNAALGSYAGTMTVDAEAVQ